MKKKEKIPQMEAQHSAPTSSSSSGLPDADSHTGQTTPEHKTSPMPPSESDQSDDGIITLQEAMRSLLEVLNAEARLDKSKDERAFLLKKLISKVQPELPDEEVDERVKTLQEKFKYFDIMQLRELVGELPKEENSNDGAIRAEMGKEKEEEEEEELAGKSPKNPLGTTSPKSIFGTTSGKSPKNLLGTASEKSPKNPLGTASEESPKNRLGKTSEKSPDSFVEESFDEDEQKLLDSLDLDEEELTELENNINAELVARLNEMGIQADGNILILIVISEFFELYSWKLKFHIFPHSVKFLTL